MNTLALLLPATALVSLSLVFAQKPETQPLSTHAAADWQTLQVEKEFHAEGAAYGDFNKDGTNDLVYGPYWYAGPDFKTKSKIYKPNPFQTKAYSQNFLTYAPDLNKDGYSDVLVLGFPGKESYWFENPKGEEGLWKRHNVLDITDNESPHWVDITGDGEPEIVCSRQGRFGYASPDPKAPQKIWPFIPITAEQSTGGKFTHGLGVGDVNGDGKMDLLDKTGWWEQPAEYKPGETMWKKHDYPFSGPGGAQMFAYDFDNDGDNDVLTSIQAHSYGLAWFEHIKEGDKITFKKHQILSENPNEKVNDVQFSQLHSLDLMDMDGDGVKDFVTGKRYFAHGGNDPGGKDPAVLYWFKTIRKGGAGKVEFQANFVHGDSGVGTQVMAGDVNKDGKPDILVGNKKGLHLHLQTGSKKKPIEK